MNTITDAINMVNIDVKQKEIFAQDMVRQGSNRAFKEIVNSSIGENSEDNISQRNFNQKGLLSNESNDRFGAYPTSADADRRMGKKKDDNSSLEDGSQ